MMGRLYFHSPCFDGIVSAVLVLDYLKHRQGWTDALLSPVNYGLKDQWLSLPFEQPSAVVDFLYHPAAAFWADHHSTTFLTPEARRHFETRSGALMTYDQRAGSCAELIQRHLRQRGEYSNPRFDELVIWAEKTDAARYDSVEEAVFGDSPALRISASLAAGEADEFSVSLVRSLSEDPLDVVANSPEVKRRFDLVRSRTMAGIERLRKAARLEWDDIVVFDVDASDVTVSRYAPYLLFPRARYSAGVVRLKDGAKITAMRNPWMEFDSVPLGPICAEFGGGGHRRVGSIALHGPAAERASEILVQVISRVRRVEHAVQPMPKAAVGG